MVETSVNYFKQVLSVVSEFDISEDASLKAADMSSLPIEGRVKAEKVAKVLDHASKTLNEPMMGIKCALKYPILQYTRPADVLKLCDNISHAAVTHHRYCPIFHTIGRSSGVVSKNGTDRMIWIPNFDQRFSTEFRQLIEFILTNYLTSINWLSWKTPRAVQQLNFKHDPAEPLQKYRDILKCDVKFGQDEYSLVLQPGVKDAPFATSDPAELFKISLKFDAALNALRAEESLIDRVEFQLRSRLKDSIPNRAVVAKALGMSERTMGRELVKNGTSFKEIKTNIIKGLATAKIDQGVPLAEIAHSLGYNDQSAFTRAYKKWFGEPPGKRKISGTK